ncbi:MAG: putative porin [Thermodesulfobacteriota bacterium]|jgi:polyhydroxyalkanoate synthesis regulator phasin|nr:putative porin [Thermodesulfobacteriota bacterium]
MKRLLFTLVIASFMMITIADQPIWAGEVDILIKKLVEKKILSHSEAQELISEIRKEEDKKKEEIKEVARESAKKEAGASISRLPKWLEKTRFVGDLRVRYQSEEKDNVTDPHRSRGRFRLRAGIETEVNEQWKAAFGIASGGANPRTTNQTFENTFDSPDLRIDYASIQYKPLKGLDILGGKFKNPLWQPRVFLWDSDIRPEGLAAKFNHSLTSNLDLFVTPGFFILEEFKNNTDDPAMWAFQPGIVWKFMDNTYLKLAGAYYVTDNLKGNTFDYSAGTNSTDADEKFLYDYNAVAGDLEIGFEFPGPIPYLAIIGQYVRSNADDQQDQDGFDDNEGWLAGLKFGHKKINEFGRWQVAYNYRRLERDAWPDFLSHSSFYNGSTNAKGHEIDLKFGLHKNVSIRLDYFKAEQIRLDSDNLDREKDWMAVDLDVKW